MFVDNSHSSETGSGMDINGNFIKKPDTGKQIKDFEVSPEIRNYFTYLDEGILLDEMDKLDIVGVVSGVKPAALLSYATVRNPVVSIAIGGTIGLDHYGWREIDGGGSHTFLFKKENEKIVQTAIKKLKENDIQTVGLKQDVKRTLFSIKRFTKQGRERCKLLKETISAFDEQRSRMLGELLGYPSTAIDAYLRKVPRSDWQDDQIYRQNKDYVIFFTGCVFSKENYAAELNSYARPMMEIIREYLPKTYQQLLPKIYKTEDNLNM